MQFAGIHQFVGEQRSCVCVCVAHCENHWEEKGWWERLTGGSSPRGSSQRETHWRKLAEREAHWKKLAKRKLTKRKLTRLNEKGSHAYCSGLVCLFGQSVRSPARSWRDRTLSQWLLRRVTFASDLSNSTLQHFWISRVFDASGSRPSRREASRHTRPYELSTMNFIVWTSYIRMSGTGWIGYIVTLPVTFAERMDQQRFRCVHGEHPISITPNLPAHLGDRLKVSLCYRRSRYF